MPYKATTGGLSVLPKPSVLLNYELLVSCCGLTITGTLGLKKLAEQIDWQVKQPSPLASRPEVPISFRLQLLAQSQGDHREA